MLDQCQNHHCGEQNITDPVGIALRLINSIDEAKRPDHRNCNRHRKQHVHRLLVQKAFHHIHMSRHKFFTDIANA